MLNFALCQMETEADTRMRPQQADACRPARPHKRPQENSKTNSKLESQFRKAANRLSTNMITLTTGKMTTSNRLMALNLLALVVLGQVAAALEFAAPASQLQFQQQQQQLARPLFGRPSQLELVHGQRKFQESQQFQQQQQQQTLQLDQLRRSDEEPASQGDESNAAAADENEAQQLRQLHQVVDTMAHLLNEEEEERRQQSAKSQLDQLAPQESQLHEVQLAPNQPNDEQQQQVQAALQQAIPAELMSESAIRQAIEELEQVQQQERQRQERQQDATGVQPSSGKQTRSNNQNMESLFDELGDEFLGGQLAASQDAERLVNQQQQQQQQQLGASQKKQKSDANIVSPLSGLSISGQEGGESLPEAAAAASSQVGATSQTSKAGESEQPQRQALVMGQLDQVEPAGSSSAELNSALTDDFYSFHAESIGAQSAGASVDQLASSSAPSPSSSSSAPLESSSGEKTQQLADSGAGGISRRETPDKPAATSAAASKSSQADLDSAAQTRNQQRLEFGAPAGPPFDESQASSLSAEFSQPAPLQPPQFQQQQQQQRSFAPTASSGQLDPQLAARSFRPQAQQQQQQAGLPSANNPFAAGSTLLPFTADAFWRPSSNAAPNDDLGQQYNRARQESGVSLPPLAPLPASRFQSLAPSGGQAPSSARNPHTHFTGHSFIAGDSFQQARGQQQPFTSTQQPIISVIGGDSVGSNSVSWNPPAAINPPPPPPPPQQQQQPFNSAPFSTSTGPRAAANSIGPGTPPFRGDFRNFAHEPAQQFNSQPGVFETQPNQQFATASRDNGNNQLGANLNNEPTIDTSTPAATTTPSSPQTTATSLFGSSPAAQTASTSSPNPIIRQQWSLPDAAPVERQAADTQPRSSVRSLPASNGAEQRQTQLFGQTGTSPATIERHSRQQLFGGQPSGAQFSSFSTEFPPATSAGPTSRNVLTTTTTGPNTSTNQPATALESANTNSTKKDDMVIYYYYYYDDNKNATVVAKNISASAAGHINGANLPADSGMDGGDGGIEDTPYMEDHVPSNAPNLGAPTGFRPTPSSGLIAPTSSQRPQPVQTTTSTTTTTTTTTAASATPASISSTTAQTGHFVANSFGAPRDKLLRHSSPSGGQRTPLATNQRPPTSGNNNRLELSSDNNNDDDDDEDADLDQFQNDQQRPPQNEPRRPGSQPQSFTGASPPNAPTSTSTFRPPTPHAQNQPSQHSAVHSNGQPPNLIAHHNQLTTQAGPRVAQSHQSRPIEPAATRQQVPKAATSGSLQSVGRAQAGQHHSQAQQTPNVSTQTQNNRASLTNASRYGTSTSNQFLDPYGMDPAAPASIPHQPPVEPGVGRNAQAHAPTQLANRRPAAPAAVDSILSATGAQLTSGSGAIGADQGSRQPASASGNRLPSSGQAFSPQRQKPQVATQANQAPRASFSEPSSVAPLERAVVQPTRGLQAAPLGRQPTGAPAGRTPASAVPEKEPPASGSLGLPEEAGGGAALAEDDQERRLPGEQSGRMSPATPSGTRKPPSTSSQNGRPISSEGNTGNGFTRAPPALVSSSPSSQFVFGSSTLASAGQRISGLQQQQQSRLSTIPASTTSASSVGGESANFSPTSPSTPARNSLSSSQQQQQQSFSANAPNLAPISTSVAQHSTPGATRRQEPAASIPTAFGGLPPSAPISTTLMISSGPKTQAQQPPQTTSAAASAAATPTTGTIASTAISTSTSTTTAATPTTTTTAATVPTTTSSTTTSTTNATQTPQALLGQDSAATESADSSSAGSTRRKFGNRNNRFQTRLNAVRASSLSSSTTSTTPAPQLAGSTTTTTRRPLSSTTRKTSKQLFAGRRRLSGPSSSSSSSSSSSPATGDASSSAASTPPSLAPAETQPSSSSNSASLLSASRIKFGNNFTARTRASTSTTNAPATDSSAAPKAGGSLFATQRATFKPRLPFMRGMTGSAKPTSEAPSPVESSSPTPSSSAGSESAPSDSSSAASETGTPASASAGDVSLSMSSASPADSSQPEPVEPAEQAAPSSGAGAGGSTEPDGAASRDAAAAAAAAGTAATTTTTTSTTTSAPVASTPKPKRPLFASRQRSSSLFGNRRPNGTASAA